MPNRELSTSIQEFPIEPLLDVRTAKRILNVTENTVRDWVAKRRIEFVKVGTRVMFRPQAIRDLIAAGTHKPSGSAR